MNRAWLPILLVASWTVEIGSPKTGSAVPSRVSALILHSQAEYSVVTMQRGRQVTDWVVPDFDGAC